MYASSQAAVIARGNSVVRPEEVKDKWVVPGGGFCRSQSYCSGT